MDISTGLKPGDCSVDAIKNNTPSLFNPHAVSPFLKNLKPLKQFNQLSLSSMAKKQILEDIEEEKRVQLTIVNQEASITQMNRLTSGNSTPKKK